MCLFFLKIFVVYLVIAKFIIHSILARNFSFCSEIKNVNVNINYLINKFAATSILVAFSLEKNSSYWLGRVSFCQARASFKQ